MDESIAPADLQCDEHRLQLRVPEALAGGRLDSLLRHRLGFGRGLIRKIRAEGRLEVNGASASKAARLRTGDRVCVVWPEANSGTARPADLHPSADPEPIPLSVVYEDRHLLAVDKPAGTLVHPVRQHRTGTLANAVCHHLVTQGLAPKARPLHRLDRGTSGLVVFAKHPYSLLRLTRALREGRFRREYFAVVAGAVQENEGAIELPIRRAEGSIIEREIAPAGEGQAARTHFRVEKRASGHTLVRVRLETGRTHQIRVHMSAIGHPLVGDGLYGREGEGARPALHAVRLALPHPVTGDRLELAAPCPPDFQELCARLGLAPGGRLT